MSDLTHFRDHCRTMATAEHKPECPSLTAKPPPRTYPLYDDEGNICALGINLEAVSWRPPACDGCNPDIDRTLFARLAAEVDDYLTDDPTLFEGER